MTTNAAQTARHDAILAADAAAREKGTTMTHSLYIRRNSMSNYALTVECICGNLNERVEYANVEDANGAPLTGVPLSLLMDIAEKHQNEEENR